MYGQSRLITAAGDVVCPAADRFAQGWLLTQKVSLVVYPGSDGGRSRTDPAPVRL